MESILIGNVANIHGIKGEIKIYPYTDDILNLTNLKSIYFDKELKEKYKIKRARVHKNMLVIKLEGINDANEALELKTKDVYIPRNALKELDDNTYYIEDLLFSDIVEEESGNVIGKLTYVFNTGANDVYEVEREDKSKIYLPAISDVIKKVDIKSKKIYVKLMEIDKLILLKDKIKKKKTFHMNKIKKNYISQNLK